MTLLAALLHQREREIADSLVEMLISISGRGGGRMDGNEPQGRVIGRHDRRGRGE
ncbi:hypothetical protein [Streptomyces sp. NPDC055039]